MESEPTFAQLLAGGAFPVVLEITPPRERNLGILWRRAQLLGGNADAIDVIQRPERMSSLDAAHELKQAGSSVVWNLVTRGRSRAEIAAELERARERGLDALLCVRGERGPADRPDTPKLAEVVALARERMPAACVGATFNQHAPRAAALRNLSGKLAAGAAFVQTQLVVDPAALAEAAASVRERWPAVRWIAMVMPLLSQDEALRARDRLGISLPAALMQRLADPARGNEPGWRAFAELLAELVRSPQVDAVAVMTPHMDPSKDYCERLASLLEETRQIRRSGS